MRFGILLMDLVLFGGCDGPIAVGTEVMECTTAAGKLSSSRRRLLYGGLIPRRAR